MDLSKKLTILVNSSDNYVDCLGPFFLLLKRYWNPQGIQILLNTETVEYSMDGLDIKCVHPKKPDAPYGERMLNALEYVQTKYVVLMLEDFFLREHVKEKEIENILTWMERDSSITYFNCDVTPTWFNWESKKYSNYKRVPPGNAYTLNMQAAIWRTERLRKYWTPDVSPWEWELYSNIYGAQNVKEKFFCAKSLNSGFLNYGYNPKGMGVFRRKWVIDDVGPLFAKEGIDIDFSIRGCWESGSLNHVANVSPQYTWNTQSDIIDRCLPEYKDEFARFIERRRAKGETSGYPEMEFSYYLLEKIQVKEYKKLWWKILKTKLKEEGFVSTVKKAFKKVFKKNNK